MKSKDLRDAATLLRALQSRMGASRERADTDDRKAWDEIERLAPALDGYAGSSVDAISDQFWTDTVIREVRVWWILKRYRLDFRLINGTPIERICRRNISATVPSPAPTAPNPSALSFAIS